MKTKWLFETGVFDDNLQELVDAVKDQGMEYQTTRYVPFEGSTYADLYQPNDCVVAYGSLQMISDVQRKVKWVPGAYCNLSYFECTHYYPRLQKYLLNNPCIMLPYGMLLGQKEFLLSTIGNNNCLFVRPSSGFKIFSGTVIHQDNYEKDVEYLGFYDVEPEKMVVVAEPKNIQREWRLVIVDKKVVAASLYKENEKLILREGCPVEVKDFAELVAHQWQPEAVWTMDIAQKYNNDLKVIEIGSFSCSGLYACNKSDIIQAVSECAAKEWNDIYDTGT